MPRKAGALATFSAGILIIALALVYAFWPASATKESASSVAPQRSARTTDAAAVVVDTNIPPAAKLSETNSSAPAAAQVVYFDPASGKIVPPPNSPNINAALMTPEQRNALSTSSQGLIQEPTGTPAGGF